MRTEITQNNRQDAATEINETDSPHSYPFPDSAGQQVQVRQQHTPNKEPQRYDGPEHETVTFSGWSDHSQAVLPVEEDMYDPDLAVDFSGTRGGMLQPG